MKYLQSFLEKYFGPIAMFMANNKFFGSLSEAFMRTTPVTLGVAFLMILGNLPVPGYSEILLKYNLTGHFDAAIGATTGILSLFVVFTFAYTYAKKSETEPLAAGMIAIASFFLVMPQKVGDATAYDQLYTGGTGLFTAILVGYISAVIYVALTQRKFTIKLPDSVPSNVSESLGPSLISLVILTLMFVIRVLFALTPFESIFMLIFGVLQAPLEALSTNTVSIIIIFTLANLFWFFGIHPNVVYGLVMPVITSVGAANITAYQNNETLPYFTVAVLLMVGGNAFGGQGATHGFIISSFRAKSEQYKQLRKLAIVPAIFNINEPLIFGTPIMLNPIYFIPMVFGPAVMSVVALIMLQILPFNLNPTIALPWTTTALLVAFFQGGLNFVLIILVVLVVNVLLWYPFVIIADKKAYKEELKIRA